MRVSSFIAQASGLRFNCLEAFAVVAGSGSYDKAADDLGLHPKVVQARVARLEQALMTPLVMTTPYLSVMEDGERFLPIAFCVLDALRSASLCMFASDWSDNLNRVYSLTVDDLYLFCLVCDSRSRKDAACYLNLDMSNISRTLARVSAAMTSGPFFEGRSTVRVSQSGERMRGMFEDILRSLADFEGKIRIGFVKGGSNEQRLSSSIAFIRRRIPLQVSYLENEICRLRLSKKGKVIDTTKREESLKRIHFLAELDESLSSPIPSSEPK